MWNVSGTHANAANRSPTLFIIMLYFDAYLCDVLLCAVVKHPKSLELRYFVDLGYQPLVATLKPSAAWPSYVQGGSTSFEGSKFFLLLLETIDCPSLSEQKWPFFFGFW